MPTNWKDFIVSTSDVLCGKPRLKGTRIPVALILGYLAAGYSFQSVIEEFPDMDDDHISACLDYARDLTDNKTEIRDKKRWAVYETRL